MKNFTPKSLLLISALMVGAGASAQNVPGFAKAAWAEEDLYKIDRPGFCLGDYNNDGYIDFFNCGLTNFGFVPKDNGEDGHKDGYWPYGFLYKNRNNQGFEKPSTARDENNVMLTGVPSAVKAEMAFVDFNNDGLLDLFVMRPYESDYGWMGGGFYIPEEKRTGTEVYINLGPDADYKYQLLEGTDMPLLCSHEDDDSSCRRKINESQAGAAAFGDYDKDGYIDILITGMEDGHKRFVYLYKNMAGKGFEKQLVANMKENDEYDLGLYLMDELGLPTEVPSKQFKPMSHGSVAFADLDNDGWLDIVTTGWSDDRYEELRTYRNLQNGEFLDVTEDYAISNVYRAYENQIKLFDYDRDGYLDILLFGSPSGDYRPGTGGRKLASILLNRAEEGYPFTFTELLETETGLAPVSASQSLLADMNGDGYADLLYKGWNPDVSNWNFYLAYYDRFQNQFVIDNDFSHGGADDASAGCGFWFGDCAFGDFNGDGYFDIVEAGWEDHINVFLNNGEEDLADAPSAPTNLAASEESGLLTITWEDLENEEFLTYYNVHILDADGKLVSFTTSALENGKLTSFPEFSTLLHTCSHTMALPNGEYIVKVQAINYGYQASEFATFTTQVKNGSGVEELAVESVVVKAVENGILATADKDFAVSVYTVAGQLVATGVANEVVPVSADGIFLVKVGDKTHKVVKF